MPKITKAKFKTYGNVFDEFTNRTLFRLIGQRHFEGLEAPIMIGKEANVFTAIKGSSKVAVKIYRLEACDFNRMYEYIQADSRYQGLKGKQRKIIFAWVQREFRNLLKAREAGVRVPKPIAIRNNVIVMELIGKPAPQLKDARPKKPKVFMEETIRQMKLLYDAGLVHADLSPFNILNHQERPVFIDFSQCMPRQGPQAEGYLKRDIKNMVNYFKKLRLKVSEESLFEAITNKNHT